MCIVFLVRPLFPKDNILLTTGRWGDWEENHRREAHLCLTDTEQLGQLQDSVSFFFYFHNQTFWLILSSLGVLGHLAYGTRFKRNSCGQLSCFIIYIVFWKKSINFFCLYHLWYFVLDSMIHQEYWLENWNMLIQSRKISTRKPRWSLNNGCCLSTKIQRYLWF